MLFESQEALLVWLIGFFGQKFHNHAILKGGMVLRLLDSPRSTNDADFVFVPYASRKDLQAQVGNALDGVPDLKWSDRLDSRAWRLRIRHGGQLAQVEITVAQECASFPVSTGPLARVHGLPGNVVRVMDLPVALSNKLAAWNERRLWRDALDLWFLHSVRRTPLDYPTLDRRLDNVVVRKGKPRRMTRQELAQALRSTASTITRESVARELADTLPPDDLVGIETRLSTALGRLAQELEESET
jgi:predicted nucleotidyltransferase component of viral defense system